MAFCQTPFVVYQPQISTIEDDNESVDIEEGSKGSVGSLFTCLKPSFSAMIDRNSFSKKHGNVTMMPDVGVAAALEKDITASSSSNLSLGQDITVLPPPPHSPSSGCYNYLLPDYVLPAPTLSKYDPTSAAVANSRCCNGDSSDDTRQQQQPGNQWAETPAQLFQVRGPTYFQDGIKVASPSPSLMVARGIDLFQISPSDVSIATTAISTTNIGQWPQLLGGKLRCAPTFICNFRFPWGILVCYFEIPPMFLPFVRYYGTIQPQQQPTRSDTNVDNDIIHNKNNFTSTADNCNSKDQLIESMKGMLPGERAFAQFLMADQTRKIKTFKLIPVVVEGPWAARYAVTGKPVIIGNKLPIQFMYVPPSPDGTMAEYLECDLDIGNSSIMARNIVTLCKRCTSELIIDFAFLVEGTAEDELPEHLMGAMRAYRLDPDHSPLFPGAEYGVYNTVITTTANNNNNNNTAITHVTRSNEDDETDDEFWDCQSTY